MKDLSKISASVISRLPRYYRFLCALDENSTIRVSSKELSLRMGLTASQIRQDFNCFGGFGQQGYGYNVRQLKEEMASILGINTPKKTILIGAGNLGRAVAGQLSFVDKGFRLCAIFDSAPDVAGNKIKDVPIYASADLKTYCEVNHPDVAVLCLPEEKAPAIVDELISFGVFSFWNFSHYDIHNKYPLANVENVHLSDSLMRLSYIIKNSEN